MKPNSVHLDVNIAAQITAGTLKYKMYSDATYEYHCFALPGTALATADWMIRRTTATSCDFAGGSLAFANAATDLATVQALSYS